MRHFLYSCIFLLTIISCKKEKIHGPVTIFGQVKDQYSQSPLSHVRICIGKYYSNWLGRKFRIRGETFTDANGNYSLTDSLNDENVIFVGIADSLNGFQTGMDLRYVYYFEKDEFDADYVYSILNPTFAKSNSENISFSLNRLAKFKCNIQKNGSIVKDSITFIGFQYLPLNVISDTTVYVNLKPNASNTVQIKRNNTQLLFEEKFNPGNGGDTIIRQLVL